MVIGGFLKLSSSDSTKRERQRQLPRFENRADYERIAGARDSLVSITALWGESLVPLHVCG